MSKFLSKLQAKLHHHFHETAYIQLGENNQEIRKISFGDLDGQARSFAAYLQQKSRPGESVLLIYPAGIDFIIAFLGCLYAGRTAIPMFCPNSSTFSKHEQFLTKMLEEITVCGIFTDQNLLDSINIFLQQRPNSQAAVFVEAEGVNLPASSYQNIACSEETIAYLQYTSGSTSSPKAALISHNNLNYNLKYTGQAWDYHASSISLNWAPHSHVYGLVCGLLLPLYFQSRCILMSPELFLKNPISWLTAISDFQVTHSGCPNFGYELCLKRANEIAKNVINLSCWKAAINGGEIVRADTLLRFYETFKSVGFKLESFYSAYGMSELTGTISTTVGKQPTIHYLNTEKLSNHLFEIENENLSSTRVVSSGKLLPGIKIQIIDPITQRILPKDNIGEIILSSRGLVKGYQIDENHAQNKAFLMLPGSRRVYFRTGDLGCVFKGELYLLGRNKDVIIRNGKNYYPADLEISVSEALGKFDLGQRLVFSTPVQSQEIIILIQEINQSIDKEAQWQIIDLARRTLLEKYGLELDQVILVRENNLPRTISGKLQRKICQQLFLEQKLDVIYSHQNSEPIFIDKKFETKINTESANWFSQFAADFQTIIAACLNKIQQEVSLDAQLSSYALDSVKVIELAAKISLHFNLELTPDKIYSYSTFKDCLEAICHEHYQQLAAYYGTQISDQIKIQPRIKRYSLNQAKGQDIAIIGVHGDFPGADNLETFWQNLIQKKEVIQPIPAERWPHEIDSINWGGFIKDIAAFDATFFGISPREAELIDPQQRIFLQTVWKTVEDAGYAISSLAGQSVGIFVGVFNHDYAEILQQSAVADAYLTTGITHSMLANRVSFLLNFRGPSEAIDTACSSSLVAIHHAVMAIDNGDCEMAIAGGVNALLAPTSYRAATHAGMLSVDGRCKTFDKNANGYVRSEGVGAIFLKPLKKALSDRDHIYGIIKGSAVNHGGHVSSLTVPNPQAQAKVIEDAYLRSGVEINSISYIEAHGTGTSLGDPIEINGLKQAFTELAQQENITLSESFCAIGSVKSHIGHLEAAAGIAGVIKVLLSMKYKQLPGNLNFNELNPYIDLKKSPFFILDKTIDWSPPTKTTNSYYPRRAGISSFGFGGTNAHLILEELPTQLTSATASGPFLMTLSAKTASCLEKRIEDLLAFLKQVSLESFSLVELSHTLNVGRDHFDLRCAILAHNFSELIDYLTRSTRKENCNYLLINKQPLKKQLSPIFQEHCSSLLDEVCHNSLPPTEMNKKLLVLANFYVEGYHIDWQKFYSEPVRRISLPTYPFAKEYHWVNRSKAIESSRSTLNKIITDSTQAELIRLLQTQLKLNAVSISGETKLSELGVDSIAIKELILGLEQTFKLALNPAIFYEYDTIQSLSKYINLQQVAKPKLNLFSDSLSPQNDLPLNEPIAIIGMHAYLPQSDNLSIFWQHLLAGTDLITEIPSERWNWQEYWGDSKKDHHKSNSKWGGFVNGVDQFDAAFFNISEHEANLMDPQQRLFLEVAWKTIEDAGYDPLALPNQLVGVFVGAEFNDYQKLIARQNSIFHGHVATGTSNTLIANRVSHFLNLNGPSEVINTACSSGLVAVHRGIQALKNGECEMVLAGGVSLMLSPDTMIITSQLGALSPDGQCKSFDKSANGYVKGEGVGAVLLKRLSDAEEAGDFIYGIIKSSVVNHGGKARSLTSPNVNTQSKLLIKAYELAEIDPATINYIETHGTGTELGDPIEIEALKKAFDYLLQQKNDSFSKKYFCGLGAVKTNIGHLEPASGIAGLIKILLALQHDRFPANIHFKELNPYINLEDSPFYICDRVQEWHRSMDTNGHSIPRRAGISSFGFGGTCSHLVLEEAPEKLAQDSTLQPYFLIILSAKQRQSLQQKIVDLRHYLGNKPDIDLTSLSFTLCVGRTHFEHRFAVVVATLPDLISALEKAIHYPGLSDELNQSAQSTSVSVAIDYPQKNTDKAEYLTLLQNIANLYLAGNLPDWRKLFNFKQRLAGLPSYPLIKKRYWFDSEINSDDKISPQNRSIDPSADVVTLVIEYLKSIFSEKLRLLPEQINLHDTYEVYGVDSLLSLEITERLERDLGSLSKTLLYEKNTIYQLANYVVQKKGNPFESKSNTSTTSSQSKLESSQPIQTLKSVATMINYDQDIAVIGIHVHFPMAKTMDEFWNNLIVGRDSIIEIPTLRWDYKEYPITLGDETKYFKYGGFIDDIDKFDPLFFNISPREAMLMDPQERLFLQSAWSAIEDAGYTRERLTKLLQNNVGVFAGVTYNFYPLLIQEEWQQGNKLPLDIQLFSVANRISYFLNLNGPSLVVDTACSSSLSAIHLACESIQRGECKAAIAGGVNLSIHPAKYHFLGGYSFLSTRGRCESFAKEGDGYVPAEGVGTIFLKPLALAEQDHDQILAVIKSTSMNHGAKTSGYTVPSPSAQASLIKTALDKAKINPETISYIEAHGTGTSLGDPIEISGLQEAFEHYTTEKQYCAIGSVKSNIGHLESAAGISQLAKVILQLQHKKLVPSIHSEELNPYIDFKNSPFYVQRELSDWCSSRFPRRAGINSFGAGGTNVHVIVEEYAASNDLENSPVDTPFIFLLSAQNKERLREYVEQFINYLKYNSQNLETQQIKNQWLHRLCFTLQVGRESMAARLAIKAADILELIQLLQNFCTEERQVPNQLWFNVNSGQSAIHSFQTATIVNYQSMIEQWIKGELVSWVEFYQQPFKTLSLPTYPFAKRRCWVKSKEVATTTSVNPTINKEDIWLMFNDKQLGFHLERELNCFHCFVGESFNNVIDRTDYINPDNLSTIESFVNNFVEQSQKQYLLKGVIYLWALLEETDKQKAFIKHFTQILNRKLLPDQQNFPFIIVTNQPNTESHAQDWSMFFNELNEQKTYATFYLMNFIDRRGLSKEAYSIKNELQQLNPNENIILFNGDSRVIWSEATSITDEVHSHSLVEIVELLLATMSNLLEMDVSEIDPEIAFLHYGMDSILGIKFIAELDKYFSNLLSPMDLYRYSTINQLSHYIHQSTAPKRQMPTQVEQTRDTLLDNEQQFLDSISHLSDTDVSLLLENELSELDDLFIS
jgi:acyl transferase domain-containing protein/acyl-CoA synthetase (AMP-forming)/AMP-acid ligase II/aryl carrier-like protein